MSQKNSLKFHSTSQAPKNFNPLSASSNAWRKVTKAGNFKNWMDYQKWILGQVKPITRYKKSI